MSKARRRSLAHTLITRAEERRLFERQQTQRKNFHAWCAAHWTELFGRPWTQADQWIWDKLEEARRQGKTVYFSSTRR